MPQHTSYSEMIRFRAPNGLSEALAEAAARDFTTSSEFVRRTVIERLRSLGIDPRGTGARGDSSYSEHSGYNDSSPQDIL